MSQQTIEKSFDDMRLFRTRLQHLETLKPFQRNGLGWDEVERIALAYEVPSALHSSLGRAIHDAAVAYYTWLLHFGYFRADEHDRIAENEISRLSKDHRRSPIAQLRQLRATMLKMREQFWALADSPLLLRYLSAAESKDASLSNDERDQNWQTRLDSYDHILQGLYCNELMQALDKACETDDRQFAKWSSTWFEIEKAIEPLRRFWIDELKRPLKPEPFQTTTFGPFVSTVMTLIDPRLPAERIKSTLRRVRTGDP